MARLHKAVVTREANLHRDRYITAGLLRRAAWILAAGIALHALAMGALYAISARRSATRYDVPVRAIALPDGQAARAEGARLWSTRGCARCHGDDATGRVILDAPPARVIATNLTTTTRGWSMEDHVRAIRNGVGPDGAPLVLMPSGELHGLSDRELALIVAHYSRLPPRDSALPQTEVRFVGRILHALGVFPLHAAERIDHDAPAPDAPEPAETAEYGAYLATTCATCHGAGFSGGSPPGAPASLGVPANLTFHSSGLAGWTRDDFVTSMRTGRRPDGTELDGAQMPWRAFRQMTDLELGALYAYFAQLEPRPFGGR